MISFSQKHNILIVRAAKIGLFESAPEPSSAMLAEICHKGFRASCPLRLLISMLKITSVQNFSQFSRKHIFIRIVRVFKNSHKVISYSTFNSFSLANLQYFHESNNLTYKIEIDIKFSYEVLESFGMSNVNF